MSNIDIKISQLGKLNTISGSDFFPIVQSSSLGTYRVDINTLNTWLAASGSASYANQSNTASYVKIAQSASYITSSNVTGTVLSASYSLSSSMSNSASYSNTSSYSLSSSYSTSASYAAKSTTSSYALYSVSSSYLSGSATGSLYGTSSWANGGNYNNLINTPIANNVLADVTLSGPAGSITATWASPFDFLEVTFETSASNLGSNYSQVVRFNGDASSNYGSQPIGSNNGQTYIRLDEQRGGTTNLARVGTYRVSNKLGMNKFLMGTITGLDNGGAIITSGGPQFGVWYNTSSRITSITLFDYNGISTFLSGSRLVVKYIA